MTQKERSRRHYLANRELYLERARQQRLKEQAKKEPKVYEYLSNTEKSYKRQEVNPRGHLLSRAKTRSRLAGVVCELSVDDIIIPEVCPYLGFPLVFNKGSAKKDSMSIDRVDNSKGYIKGNVEVISHLANSMKRDSTKEEQIRFAKEVLKRHEVS